MASRRPAGGRRGGPAGGRPAASADGAETAPTGGTGERLAGDLAEGRGRESTGDLAEAKVEEPGDGPGGWCGWRVAAERALYGPGGFFRRPEGPAGHFRTSVHVSARFAGAVAELLRRVDEALAHPAELSLVDVGAGRGELLTGVLAAVPEPLAARLRPYAVERAPRPYGLDARVAWLDALPPPRSLCGLVFANEWLDDVPLDVAEVDRNGVPRRVLVDPRGTERLGEPVCGADADWLARWWPVAGAEQGTRAEIGRPRDAAWARAVRCLRAGLAVAVDYGHQRAARPPYGTLTGFRGGREVPPVPDGSCDLTAHLALDACAAAGAQAATPGSYGPEPYTPEPYTPGVPGSGVPGSGQRAEVEASHETGSEQGAGPGQGAGPVSLGQREALHALGVDGRRPPLTLATSDPAGYVRALAAAGEAAELTDPAGLGGFTWLLQPVGAGSRDVLRPAPTDHPPTGTPAPRPG